MGRSRVILLTTSSGKIRPVVLLCTSAASRCTFTTPRRQLGAKPCFQPGCKGDVRAFIGADFRRLVAGPLHVGTKCKVRDLLSTGTSLAAYSNRWSCGISAHHIGPLLHCPCTHDKYPSVTRPSAVTTYGRIMVSQAMVDGRMWTDSIS